jgi:hypothetical protein
MNSYLQKLFSIFYSPDQTQNAESGASSVTDTGDLRIQIENLCQISIFEKIDLPPLRKKSQKNYFSWEITKF